MPYFPAERSNYQEVLSVFKEDLLKIYRSNISNRSFHAMFIKCVYMIRHFIFICSTIQFDSFKTFISSYTCVESREMKVRGGNYLLVFVKVADKIDNWLTGILSKTDKT